MNAQRLQKRTQGAKIINRKHEKKPYETKCLNIKLKNKHEMQSERNEIEYKNTKAKVEFRERGCQAEQYTDNRWIQNKYIKLKA